MTSKLPTSIEGIREFVEKNPHHPLSAAWGDMLYDMDEFGEEYTLGAFLEEAYCQVGDGNIGIEDLFDD